MNYIITFINPINEASGMGISYIEVDWWDKSVRCDKLIDFGQNGACGSLPISNIGYILPKQK